MVSLYPTDPFAEVARPVIAVGTDYADGDHIRPHFHRRAQLLYGLTGVVMVSTQQGAWMMPPEGGLWIPPGTVHEVRMLGAVRMRSLYLAPDATAAMPRHCEVFAIPGLMRSLLAEAVTLPREYDPAGRDGTLMALILHDMRRLRPLSLSVPLPADTRLHALCSHFLRAPTPHARIDDWAGAYGASRRTFTRLFRRETGLSFAQWRQRACVLAALPRLARGVAVTTVAAELGYDNPAAFTTMFKRIVGLPPREYAAAGPGGPG